MQSGVVVNGGASILLGLVLPSCSVGSYHSSETEQLTVPKHFLVVPGVARITKLPDVNSLAPVMEEKLQEVVGAMSQGDPRALAAKANELSPFLAQFSMHLADAMAERYSEADIKRCLELAHRSITAGGVYRFACKGFEADSTVVEPLHDLWVRLELTNIEALVQDRAPADVDKDRDRLLAGAPHKLRYSDGSGEDKAMKQRERYVEDLNRRAAQIFRAKDLCFVELVQD